MSSVRAILALWAVLLTLVPSATANLEVIFRSEHADHGVLVPESRRAQVPIQVFLKAEGFVCAQPATFTVNVVLTNPEIAVYGASPNPDSSRATFELGKPGQGPEEVQGKPDINLDIFWSEDRPRTNAQTIYTISSKDDVPMEGGPCLPGVGTIKPGQIQIPAHGADLPEPTTNNTACPPEEPDCGAATETIEPKADSPGFGPALLLLGAAVVFLARRRRL